MDYPMGSPSLWWENNTTVLFGNEGTTPTGQLVRCNLTGACNLVAAIATGASQYEQDGFNISHAPTADWH
jgi:hypothetical protein